MIIQGKRRNSHLKGVVADELRAASLPAQESGRCVERRNE
jgi:hypothetical protein